MSSKRYTSLGVLYRGPIIQAIQLNTTAPVLHRSVSCHISLLQYMSSRDFAHRQGETRNGRITKLDRQVMITKKKSWNKDHFFRGVAEMERLT